MDQKTILETFTDILKETKFLIQNHSISIYRFQDESDPNDFVFPWKSKVPESIEIQKKQQKENQRKKRLQYIQKGARRICEIDRQR